MPDIVFDSLDLVPEGLREAAVEDDGKVKVNVVPKAKLDEFRNNNVTISKERDTLLTQLARAKTILGTEDFDEAERTITEVRGVFQRVKDGELVENKGLEEAVNERVQQMRADHESERQRLAREGAAWKDKFSATDQKLRRSTIDRALTDVILDSSSGVEPKALTDILSRAYKVFVVGDDGTITPKKGDVTIYGADGATPMTPKEWVASLKDEAPYFFKGSNGGGAGGGDTDTKKINGFTAAEIAKMDPMQRLRLANGEKIAKV